MEVAVLLFFNTAKVYQFTAKKLRNKRLFLGNVSKDLKIIMKINRIKRSYKVFPVVLNPWWKKAWYKIMFGLTKKIFMGLLSSIVNASNHTKCVLLNNQKCRI